MKRLVKLDVQAYDDLLFEIDLLLNNEDEEVLPVMVKLCSKLADDLELNQMYTREDLKL